MSQDQSLEKMRLLLKFISTPGSIYREYAEAAAEACAALAQRAKPVTGSIDTPEFDTLLERCENATGFAYQTARANLVAYIDAQRAPQAAEQVVAGVPFVTVATVSECVTVINAGPDIVCNRGTRSCFIKHATKETT